MPLHNHFKLIIHKHKQLRTNKSFKIIAVKQKTTQVCRKITTKRGNGLPYSMPVMLFYILIGLVQCLLCDLKQKLLDKKLLLYVTMMLTATIYL